ncbi:MAG: electron transfer protein with DM13 domain protein [Oscillatoriales cyanobacterium]|uniref:DM13 domain-containing protein n=1 Tax=Microcoleus anatoxicus PTRS2 TaxID=2705321 RepID=A0ABU8YHS2_9CYAN|nr:MAG: electron transfer protein with DM13 domain protein [Oscillatoriales cyanobacterium]TAD98060.1 MAG: electron transfer protein with DM13 domain protein [Oscillatoriales cyanobacterium]TAE06339.1 MAG: electron transfer protein with DM13 domain protein [Oscillatoriales cyanobacterium]TAF05158.1 MAG: electron transfer protein with DM13 domain protein [Oscillatoriales cyanobacterium]TAF47102.1 MAG: electron transfer protein with DM13 domain protein [Oscillatoriales cyanobacterium]
MKRRYFNFASLTFVSTIAIACIKTPGDRATIASSVTPETTPTGPTTSPATAQVAKVLTSGTFVDGEHPTKGTARIVQKGNERILELDRAFQTSTSGPDLVVILHKSPDVIGSTVPPAYPLKKGDYVSIAPLKSYSGAQSYAIPASINSEDYASAAIWCRKFNATFGAATLQRSSS